MLKRSTKLLLTALHQSFSPPHKELLINAFCMAFSITLAVFIAKSLNLPAPYWAGISAMMVIMPTLEAMLRKGFMRLFGTYLGALVGFTLIKLGLANYPWLFFCVLFFSVAIPLAWTQTARYPYAVLIGGITCDMVMLTGMVEPARVGDYAQTRAIEITVGALTSLLLYYLITLFGKISYQIEIKERRRKPLHALAGSRIRASLSAGLAGCVAVGLWLHFQFSGIDQSITTVWVLSFSGTAFDTYHKGFQRFGGCLMGGIVAALFLLIPTPFPAFLALVFCFSLFCSIIQNGPLYGRYFGLQAVFAFLIVYANTEGPEPAMFRLLTILNGLILVLFFSVLITGMANRLPKLIDKRK